MKKFIAGLVIICTLTLTLSPVSSEISKGKVKEPVKNDDGSGDDRITIKRKMPLHFQV
ncbi:hypothetical protein ACT7C3_11100 [Bacillus pacificus]